MKNLPPLLSEVLYGSLFVYSPRGTSETSEKSRTVCYGIKGDRSNLIPRAIQALKPYLEGPLGEFFGPDKVLVPVPRSAPIQPGALWPGKRIADEMLLSGIAGHVNPCLIRAKLATKSSTAGRGNRPSPAEHMETLECSGGIFPINFTLVDDVITKGSTIAASAAVLKAAYPQSTVRAFALVRTMGMIPEVHSILAPWVGVVRCDQWGNALRDPNEF